MPSIDVVYLLLIIPFSYCILLLVIDQANSSPMFDKNLINKKNISENFLAVKSDKINMRTGPNNRYDIKYIYIKKNMVFKITDSFEEWYKVEDIDGEEGWIKKNLFFHSKKQKFAMIRSKDSIFCYSGRNTQAKKVFKIDYLGLVKLVECRGEWCLVKKQDLKAWCESKFLWGSGF